MECKFTINGLSIDYFGTVKPCCIFEPDSDYQKENNIKFTNLVGWHQGKSINKIKQSLSQDDWPSECGFCQKIEMQGRKDSMRLNAQSAYSDYNDQDIILEIRAGSICNFACQTCWPQASSRVAQFYRRAKIDFIPSHDMDWDFNLLEPIKNRIRSIVLLGGEPFYDKRCLEFLDWLKNKKSTSSLTIFTNGSMINQEFVKSYLGKLTIVFSIDAINRPSEYIRFGSVWKDVQENYQYCRGIPNTEVRINITTSPYNYYYLPDLMGWISRDWPGIVTFGMASTSMNSDYMDESVFPIEHRSAIEIRVGTAIDIIKNVSSIDPMQRINAVNALSSIINNLKNFPYDRDKHERIKTFIKSMDQVKKIKIWNYCPETAGYLDINPGSLA